jgi:RNA-splicing ligase RtcB
MIELNGKYNTAKVFTDNIEATAISQIVELCSQKFAKNSKIRIMPDTHAGAGCTIGTTMTIQDKIVPNLVGVDIGCGMYCVKLKEKEIDFQKLDDTIRKFIPSGQNIRETEHKLMSKLNLKELKCFNFINEDRALKSLGTLGGGNHFIEVDKDDEGNLYLVIHSGSRYLGKQVAEHYQELGYKKLTQNRDLRVELINKLKKEGREKDIKKELSKIPTTKINKQLAYIEEQDLSNYLNDMKITQKYAEINRIAMASELLKNMDLHEDDSFTTIHNYIDINNKILRKGAISATKNEKVIIPINMRDGSLICIGKGNEDWNNSAPHGAGRILSRSKANEKVTLEEFQDSMKEVWTTSVCKSTIDESPMVYKPMQEIIDNIQDTVNIVNIIKPLYNFKANS